MYLEGNGTKFSMAILVGQTDRYTVEFWFHPNTAVYKERMAPNQTVSYLFTMAGAEGDESQTTRTAKNAMEIYVEDNKLKCAPFGRPTGVGDAEKDVLVYGDINPFLVDEWQHITCIFVKDRYVKG